MVTGIERWRRRHLRRCASERRTPERRSSERGDLRASRRRSWGGHAATSTPKEASEGPSPAAAAFGTRVRRPPSSSPSETDDRRRGFTTGFSSALRFPSRARAPGAVLVGGLGDFLAARRSRVGQAPGDVSPEPGVLAPEAARRQRGGGRDLRCTPPALRARADRARRVAPSYRRRAPRRSAAPRAGRGHRPRADGAR